MTIQRRLLTAALIAAFGIGVPAFAVDSHQHAAGEPTKLMLDHGKQWATDEALRRNMSEIRAALAAKASGYPQRDADARGLQGTRYPG
jgi:hypothetical protein